MKQTINLKHFQQLTKDRQDSLRLLNKTSMRGIRDSIIEKYSEKAHFVYELLQNADDVQATKVQFKVREEGLYFIHNGTVRFTVSPPNQSPVGHINAITSIGHSSKKEATFKIGKFGIGFKSVFQYTTTPHIYDPKVAFSISDLIVPTLLEEVVHPMKTKEETLFFFPFNHPNKTAKEAQKEIQTRLQALQFPLLFLNNLQNITWETEEASGGYACKIQEEDNSKTKNLDRVICTKIHNKKTQQQALIKITKQEEKTKLSYSIAFLIDKENNFIADSSFPAHCFFPTRVNTHLKFLIHAPFLLTDSREGIKLEDAWNKALIQALAVLLTDSFEPIKAANLLNSSFFDCLPFEEKHFKTKSFFFPVYQQLQAFFASTKKAWFPSESGHSTATAAYVAESKSLRTLIETKQLIQLTGDEKAQWVFPNVSAQSPLGIFIRKLFSEIAIKENKQSLINWEAAICLMDADFLTQQSDEWLISWYEELLQSHRSLWAGAKALLKQKPIVRLENGTMVLPFSAEAGKPNAYLPAKLSTNYATVKAAIAQHENARSFLENLGLTTPILRDELEHYILPKFEEAKTAYVTALPPVEELEKIIRHFWQCNVEEAEQLIEQLATLPILQAVSNEDGSIVAATPKQAYFEDDLLTTFFEGQENIFWLPLESIYADLGKTFDKNKVLRFFEKVGVARLPRFLSVEDTLEETEKTELMQRQSPGASYAMWEETIDYELEGLIGFLNKEYFDVPESLFLWGLLTRVLASEMPIPRTGIYRYEYERKHEIEIEAHWIKLLKTYTWVLNGQGDMTSADMLTLQKLYPDYNAKPEAALVQLLFKESTQERLQFLSTEERRAMELGQQILQKGFNLEDLNRFQQWQSKKQNPTKKERKPKKTKEEKDQDEYNPAFLSSEELLEKQQELKHRLEAELQNEIDALMHLEQLKATIKEQPAYSYLWYKSLLELEYLLAFDQLEKDKSLSIYFEQVEREEDTIKTITLKKPARPIPMTIEAMGDITLKLQLEKERRTVEVEVVSIKDFSLRAKLKSPEEIEGVDFKKIRGAVLEIQNTIFTLEELIKSFDELDFEDSSNLKTLLPETIRFIFGPPGTGKTTYLAQQEIMPTLMGSDEVKVLVLTPTNKSADVLVKKILESFTDVPDWLYRFGTSGDMVVENAGLLIDGTFKISEQDKYCIITTATRFPYDGFEFGRPEYQLKNIDWDVILVDEASMITLPMITYLIHQQPTAEIIIAGDPFQIEPIVHAEEWKGQNIYTLVNLQSFDPAIQKEQLEPHSFAVHNLITQYRSVSTLGYIYSHLAYEGKLRHHRLPKDRRPLKLKTLALKEVNIIRFPIVKLETLLRPQKLNSSHYHIYSAILTAELVQHLAQEIYEHNLKDQPKAEGWRLGIICPYKAQAMLVDKIIASQQLSRPKLRITCGTIHSFQGDECDIMINLFNPPYRISKSPNMFLNRQNILNVAVSRAKDYLILLLPDEHTPNRENLYQINRLEKIIQYYVAGVTQKWHSYDIEEKLFGQVDYIEQNTFATMHQSINVYTKPEKQYEIRCEDTAIDVQINRD